MSYNRLNYDDDTYKTNLLSSISPGLYMLEPVRNDCQKCTLYGSEMNISYNADGKCSNLIDVDSELLGITRKKSKCPSKAYLPSAEPFCNPTILKEECDFLRPEHTKLSAPPCFGAREVGINRWSWLPKDPQDKALVPFDYLINNRIVVRDNHRPLIQQPKAQDESLPPACNDNIFYDWSSRYQGPSKMPAGIQLGRCESIRAL